MLLVSYGGPDGPDDVLPFLRNATAGRGVPDERLAEVGDHYASSAASRRSTTATPSWFGALAPS